MSTRDDTSDLGVPVIVTAVSDSASHGLSIRSQNRNRDIRENRRSSGSVATYPNPRFSVSQRERDTRQRGSTRTEIEN